MQITASVIVCSFVQDDAQERPITKLVVIFQSMKNSTRKITRSDMELLVFGLCVQTIQCMSGIWNLLYTYLHIARSLNMTVTFPNLKKFITRRNISPKSEISAISYSSTCCSKPVWISLFRWTQHNILWKMLLTKHFYVSWWLLVNLLI